MRRRAAAGAVGALLLGVAIAAVFAPTARPSAAIPGWDQPVTTVAEACRIALERNPDDPDVRRRLLDAPLDADPAALMPVWRTLLERAADAEARTAALGWIGPGRPRLLRELLASAPAPHRRALVIATELAPSATVGAPATAAPAPPVVPEADRSLVTDPFGRVTETVLAAEAHVARAQASELAAAWLHALSSDRRRAGALLAALLGEHGALVARVHDREFDGRVRVALALALAALGAPAADVDPRELAHRALHRAGRIDYDVLLVGLVAGDRALLRTAAAPPATGDERIRARVLARTIPGWHAALVADTAALDAERANERLVVRADLEWRHLAHDADHGVWVRSHP